MIEMRDFEILWRLSNKANQVYITIEEKLCYTYVKSNHEKNYKSITEYLEIFYNEDHSLTSSIIIQIINMFKNIKTLKLYIEAELNAP